MKVGFKCGVGLFRCAHDIPITSFKVTCSASHSDCREIIDFVRKNHVIDKKTGKKLTRLYAYGASLGALILGSYLVRAKENSKLDGAGLYATPYDVKAGHDYFYTKCWGFYSWVIGVNLANYIHKYCLNDLFKYLDDEKEKARIK